MARLIKKMGFKETRDFYHKVAEQQLEINDIIDTYQEIKRHDDNIHQDTTGKSADGYNYVSANEMMTRNNDDVLVIDRNLKGIDFQLSHCCNPIYGDDVFGFVTVSGGVKIHRTDCPNAPEMRKRFGYRVIRARWSGKGQSQYSITLRVVGNDDIGIVNNLTSIISKEEKLSLRSISIDSHDGLFSGNLVVMVEDISKLEALIKRLRTVKGVKNVMRI